MNPKIAFPKSVAGIAALAIASSLGAAVATWQRLPSLPEPNGGAAMGATGGQVVVASGTNWRDDRKHWLTTVYFLDSATLQWIPGKALPQAVAYGLAGNLGDALVIVGGSTGTAPFPGIVRVTGADRAISSQPTGGVAAPAVLSGGGVIGEEMIFAGGSDDAANVAGFSRNAYAVNLRTGVQRVLPSFPGPAFGTAATAVAAGELLIFGGATWDAKDKAVVNLAEAHAFSPKRNAWRALKALPYPVRGIAAVALNERYVYVAGGYTNDQEPFTDRALLYDLATDRYAPAPALPYRAGVTLVVSGGFVYCLGGEDRPKHRSDGAYRIRIADLLP